MEAFAEKSAHPKHRNEKEVLRENEYLRSKVKNLSSLIDVSIIINSTYALEELIALVMEKAQTVMNAEASSVMIINEEKNVLEIPVALGEVGEEVKKIEIKIGEGIAGWVALHGKPEIVPDVSKDPRFFSNVDKSTGFQTRSILAAPLLARDKIIGVAEVLNRNDGKAFNGDDLELFTTFCNMVALSIENARIHQLELEKQRMTQQLEAARFIQESFMVHDLPQSPNNQFDLAAKTLPAISVGGDFFNFFEFEDKSIGVTIGDVSGKGVPAALFMARSVSDLRLYTLIHKNPSPVLDALNKILHDRSRRGMFVTSLYGILNSEEGEFTFSNAGHLPIIKIDKQRTKAEIINSDEGIPLGISSKSQYEQKTVLLNQGDSLVMITDGVIEAKNNDGEAYAMERLIEKLNDYPVQSAQETLNFLLDDVKEFAENSPQHDDITIVVIKWQ